MSTFDSIIYYQYNSCISWWIVMGIINGFGLVGGKRLSTMCGIGTMRMDFELKLVDCTIWSCGLCYILLEFISIFNNFPCNYNIHLKYKHKKKLFIDIQKLPFERKIVYLCVTILYCGFLEKSNLPIVSKSFREF
jgi:hypothetical protein